MEKKHNGILSAQIKLMDIDKSAIYVGAKNKYLNVSIILYDEKNEYDQDGMISQDLGKERREAGEKLVIGNVKWAIKPSELEGSAPSSPSPPAKVDDDDDDFPF